MSRKDTSRRDMWEKEDFEDIRSHSAGDPPQFDWFANRERAPASARPSASRERSQRQKNTERERRSASPRQEERGGRPAKGRPAGSTASSKAFRGRKAGAPPGTRGASPRGRPEPQPRKRRKPMSLGMRRSLMILGVLAMVGGTAFLAESLLLRVTEVQVTGDLIYAEADIKSVCGFSTGDNLLLIPAKDREEKLETQMPYIAKAKISRHIPGTVVIEITAAQPVCSMQSAGSWLLMSGSGKVLEALPAPKEGILQVTGLSPVNTQPGQIVVLEDKDAMQAFTEILEKIAELDAAGLFTRLVMTDLSDIRLWYQDRVECRLGDAAQLDYKLQTAYDLLQEEPPKGIGQNQTGTLNLTEVPATRKSYFTEEAVTPPGGVTVTPAPATPVPAAQTPQPSPSPTPEPETEEGGESPEEDEDWTEPEEGQEEEDWDGGWEEPDEDWTGPEEWEDGGETGGDEGYWEDTEEDALEGE